MATWGPFFPEKALGPVAWCLFFSPSMQCDDLRKKETLFPNIQYFFTKKIK
jgi:hypothetical protein